MTYFPTLEITGCIIRLCPSEDPYVYDVAVAVVGDEGEAHIKALTQPPGGLTSRHRRAIFKSLRDHGFTVVHWRRRGPLSEGGAVRDEKHFL